jgi:hypothetical protein
MRDCYDRAKVEVQRKGVLCDHAYRGSGLFHFRRLALHFCIGSTYAAKHKDVRKRPNRSHDYAFRSRAAPTNTSNGTGMYRLWSKGRNPVPAPAILVRNAG